MRCIGVSQKDTFNQRVCAAKTPLVNFIKLSAVGSILFYINACPYRREFQFIVECKITP